MKRKYRTYIGIFIMFIIFSFCIGLVTIAIFPNDFNPFGTGFDWLILGLIGSIILFLILFIIARNKSKAIEVHAKELAKEKMEEDVPIQWRRIKKGNLLKILGVIVIIVIIVFAVYLYGVWIRSDDYIAIDCAKGYVKYKINIDYGYEGGALVREDLTISNVNIVSKEHGYYNTSSLDIYSMDEYIWVNGTIYKITGEVSWTDYLFYYDELVNDYSFEKSFIAYILKTDEDFNFNKKGDFSYYDFIFN